MTRLEEIKARTDVPWLLERMDGIRTGLLNLKVLEHHSLKEEMWRIDDMLESLTPKPKDEYE